MDTNKITNAETAQEKEKNGVWVIGEQYLIFTVTMYVTGKLEVVTDNELKLSNAAWIADTGRLNDALLKGLESVSSSEIEPFPNDIIVGRGAIIKATIYPFSLPSKQK